MTNIIAQFKFFRNHFWAILFLLFSIFLFFFWKLIVVYEQIPETTLEFYEAEEGNFQSKTIAQNFSQYQNYQQNKEGNLIVASKKGSKYYFLWCKNSIKEKNKIYFKSEEEAKSRGLTLSSTCK